ncbi:hypothetical protein KCP69_19685 [Salmonella enterica subsp. enterica]|nr:hypothetical protein KCP69_19685 [Salmonella enterica subsp. enterica]
MNDLTLAKSGELTVAAQPVERTGRRSLSGLPNGSPPLTAPYLIQVKSLTM